MKRENHTIISNENISEDIYEMIIDAPIISKDSKPGQFINVYTKKASELLARPISICESNENNLKIVYKVVGKGTDMFKDMKSNDDVEIMGPLGNGYDIKNGKILVVGGGVGIPPLVELCKQIKNQNISNEISVVLGYRDNSYLSEEFKKYANVYITSDLGTEGFKGNAVEFLKQNSMNDYDFVYSCGPKPMLKALKEYCLENSLEGQFSLEERMGCGFGACVGCVVEILSDDGTSSEYKKVCKDGPVFDYRKVVL